MSFGSGEYGYLNVDIVEGTRAAARAAAVVLPVPHQTAYVVPTERGHGRARGRATRACRADGHRPTAVNALSDAAPLIGDRVTVISAGMDGCCVARLLSRFPATEVTLVDIDAAQAGVAAALGVDFALPGPAPPTMRRPRRARQLDVRRAPAVAGSAPRRKERSTTSAGRQRRQDSAVARRRRAARRLGLRASQVGTMSPARAAAGRRPNGFALALELLREPGVRRARHRTSRVSRSCPK